MQHPAKPVAQGGLEVDKLLGVEPLSVRGHSAPKASNAGFAERDLDDPVAAERHVESGPFAKPLD